MSNECKIPVSKFYFAVLAVTVFVFIAGSIAIVSLNINQFDNFNRDIIQLNTVSLGEGLNPDTQNQLADQASANLLLNTTVGIALLFFSLATFHLCFLVVRLYKHSRPIQDASYFSSLLNRGALASLAQTLVSLNARFEQKMCFIITSIDGYKLLKEQEDQIFVNNILRETYVCFTENLRETDIVSRYNECEFLLILPNTGKDEGYRLAETLRAKILNKNFDGKQITVSVGCVEIRKNEVYEDVMERANTALLCARQGGENQTVVA